VHGLIATRTITAAAGAFALMTAAGMESGKYRVFGPGKSYTMLLVPPQSDDALVFGVSTWPPSGSNFSVTGTARHSGPGWIYRDKMNAANPDERCGVNILPSSDSTYRVTTVEGARCEAMALGKAPASFGMEDSDEDRLRQTLGAIARDCGSPRQPPRKPHSWRRPSHYNC
jgi:hypothetical protein